ncbi:HD-GYP domain-containing protein [Thiomicrorhabdus arctica]|uniref:HD-GYP domain-containing protein n=1 Tax=Thiomicrorhabdus arctica TaxID=131540 RepID=UPI000382309A|nr:HD domain-containing phosphohydrolase [Thiomicrorhabdus arctica]
MPRNQLNASRILYLSQMTFTSVLAQIVFALLLSTLLILSGIEENLVFTWLTIVYVILGFRYYTARQTIKQERLSLKPDGVLTMTQIRSQAIILFALSIAWSLSFIFLFMVEIPEHQSGYHMIAAIFTVGLIAGGVTSLGTVRLVLFSFAIPMTLTVAYLFFAQGDLFHIMSATATIAGISFLLIFSTFFSKQFDKSILQTQEIKDTELEIITRLAKASEFRDEETGNHILRMSYNCYLLSMACGFDKERAELMLYASSLHDVGKIGISDTVLLKPGKFTAEERLIMNKHPLIGANILGNSKSALIKLARTIALYHHEKVDGTGYPHGLIGDKIPIEARIAAICDVYDALTSVRPYKEAWTNEQALTFIIDNAGSHFDAELVQNFQNIYPQILEYAQTYSDC